MSTLAFPPQLYLSVRFNFAWARDAIGLAYHQSRTTPFFSIIHPEQTANDVPRSILQ